MRQATLLPLVLAMSLTACSIPRDEAPAVPDGAVEAALGERPATPPPPTPLPPFVPTPARQVTGGVVSSSERYRALRSIGLPPGAQVQRSQRYRVIGGLVPSLEQ